MSEPLRELAETRRALEAVRAEAAKLRERAGKRKRQKARKKRAKLFGDLFDLMNVSSYSRSRIQDLFEQAVLRTVKDAGFRPATDKD